MPGPLSFPSAAAPRSKAKLLEQWGRARRVFELRASNTDASLYLHPAPPNGEYDYGLERFATDALAHTFNPSGQLRATSEPHLSIKQSGQVHIRARGRPLAGPLQINPNSDSRHEHRTCGRLVSVS